MGPVATVGNGLDLGRLAAMLKALGSPVRLELLLALRAPCMLTEIRLKPRRRDHSQAARAMNRVSVRQHLDSLLSIGAVREVRLPRDGRLHNHFVLDYGQLFALTEELRQLARLQADATVLDRTMPGGPEAPAALAPRPHLVLANGICEGQSFPLADRGRREWLIGRSPDADILLEYDPYVSLENSRVTLTRGGYAIADLTTSRNGTTVNWERQPPGVAAPLQNGDVVCVGRSVLVFRS